MESVKSVGVRELRQSASELLRRVAEGESIVITDRGTPIARLVPLARTGGVADLVNSNQVRLPSRPMPALRPMRAPGGRTASAALAEAREHER